ncbi:metal ABC transporter ATP-binding protein [Arthrobacter sp. ATA002]|uniref:metal ABC transporter ATP-binding protein n=1 Tax=Arthrobacter sp. ATA002 TaxID=2991715 RepID=UPI0022A77216|nr:metal ABC transporter ATP-binding protein [Arthrobacter sp. ATA002]WAP53316.1 metal ABC transporter ATP-binding protein [Arthrobacter sp. ATA002]
MRLRNAGLSFGQRTLWDGLDLDIRSGEFLAVLGPNGSGKTSFLKVLLGLQELTRGTVEINGHPARRGSPDIGYIPQQKAFAPGTPLRARDLVGLGVDGNKWGLRLNRAPVRRRVDQLLEQVGAVRYADEPVGLLSGGEVQRLRAAQALATDPDLLLCDEPLLSLDLHHQQAISALIDRRCHEEGSAVVFVTHEINPVIDYVDRVLYLAGGTFRTGTPSEVLRSDVLSEMYGSRVEVLRSHGRIVVLGIPDATTHVHGESGDDHGLA